MLRFYNTLHRKIEEFIPLNPPLVGFYSCGPTVYDFAHIGHARTFVFADSIARVVLMNGYKLKWVMNVTDVGHLTSDSDTGEDKMEKGAIREKKTVWDIARFYTDDFFLMLQKLNIKKPDVVTLATEYVPQMIEMVKVLEKKEFTYTISDGVYFDTSKCPDYGKLTGKTRDELVKGLKAGARIEMIPGKKNATDFALWKLTPKGIKRQMEWDSPWGRGFPGWHIECSVMSSKTLGDTIDIHSGGVDHIPIHHTNEIAQSECATGKPFVRNFLHGEHLLIDGKKMSKSLGNYHRVNDVIKKGYEPLALRYLFLTTHYRQQMNFTWTSIEAAQNAYQALVRQVKEMKLQMRRTNSPEAEEIKAESERYKTDFINSVNDDLNFPKALGVVWQVLKSRIPPSQKYPLLLFFDRVSGLGLYQLEASKTVRKTISAKAGITLVDEIPSDIQKLARDREFLRDKKDYYGADNIRKDIEKKGYVLEDTPTGPKLRKEG